VQASQRTVDTLNVEHCNAKKRKSSFECSMSDAPPPAESCDDKHRKIPCARCVLSIPYVHRPATKDQWLPIIRLGIPRCVFASDIVESDRDRQIGVSSPGMDRCRNQPLFLRLPAVNGLCVSQPQFISLLLHASEENKISIRMEAGCMLFAAKRRVLLENI
jgi:hypothetical protein